VGPGRPGAGPGAAHKEEVPGLRSQIEAGRKLDAQFAQAQSQASSTDKNTLLNVKATFDAIAGAGGRHASEARTLATKVGKTITDMENAARAEAEKASAAKADQQRKIENAITDIHKLEEAHNFSAARAKLSELQGLGENTSSLSAEIDQSEKAYAISQRGAICKVVAGAHEKWNGPLQAGMEYNAVFLDTELQLTAGANCGLPSDVLQSAQKSSEARLQVMVDTEGNVTDGQPVAGFPSPGPSAIAAAKSGWHFSAPKISGKPVKTRVTVSIRFK